MKTLIKNLSEIYTGDDNPFHIKNGYIIINNNQIEKIGSGSLPPHVIKERNFDKIIDGSNKMALPGFVNCHTHAAMSLLRGIADDLPLQEWLKEIIWPVEASLTPEDIYWGSKFAIMEMISGGTTTFSDMYFSMEQVARAASETGIRAVLGQGLIEEKDGPEGLKTALDFAVKWKGKANGKIKTVLAPHAPYTCSPSYLCDIIELSKKNNFLIHIHLAETKKELQFINKNYNASPVEHLNNIGLLETPLLAAHCVHVKPHEFSLMKKHNVGVAHNPVSNMKLGSGIAPIAELLEHNINIGLGTDGAASNNNLDLIEEARTASYLQKVEKNDPSLLNLQQLLQMLTQNGARVLKINKLGILKNNYLADIILINKKNDLANYPEHNSLSNLFYAGNRKLVDTVIVDGQIIYKNCSFVNLDQQEVLAEVTKRAQKLTD